jgi:hypothetical protein
MRVFAPDPPATPPLSDFASECDFSWPSQFCAFLPPSAPALLVSDLWLLISVLSLLPLPALLVPDI